MTIRVPFAIRPFDPEADQGVVISYWLNSYRRHVHHVRKHQYFSGQHAIVSALIARSTVLIAHAPESPDVVYGWICGEPSGGPEEWTMIHYAFVKEAYQGFGIGRALVSALLDRRAKDADAQVVCTHRTTDELWQRCKREGWRTSQMLAVYSALEAIGGQRGRAA